ncbi:MAG: hypothetical protein F6K18_04635 [Okeania sp. SIO2C2]|uniref:hypothetical protein n=1 Tax=Okeania sp. SIO2C2 TaxID=2607787 RepID=UPI0013BAD61D|nr:hypothetical protein [Okeania sp. SIO2C2]NEP86161.1 hypothetical protein [Okeania sp. SIO2C2]
MRYPDEDMNQMMGIGQYLGEIRQAPDGNLYQWVEGIDGLGRRGGFWKRAKRRAKKLVKKVARMTPAGQALRLLPVAKRIARRRARMAGYEGIGGLYEAPDGSIYQMQGMGDYEDIDGIAASEELYGLSEDDLTEIMGIGTLGEIQQGPDGNLYQWTEDLEGIDGLGRRRRRRRGGRWKRFKRRFKRGLKKVRGGVKKVLRKALPVASTVATFLPLPGARAAAAGIRAATPLLRRAGFAGLGELYESPDGTLYQMQGIADYEEIDGLAQEDELEGLGQEYEMEGFADDHDDIDGFVEEDDELEGFADDYDDIDGLAEEDEEELEGLGQGYVQHQDNIYGVEGYVPHRPPATRWFKEPSQVPKIWEAPW